MGILKGLYDGPDLQLTYLSTEYLIGFEPVFGQNKSGFRGQNPK
jgi:hypothetical protein